MGSAELSGLRLLTEQHEEGLDELLQTLRTAAGLEAQPSLGIDALDELLTLFRYPAVSANTSAPDLLSEHDARDAERSDGYPINPFVHEGTSGPLTVDEPSGRPKPVAKPPIVSVSTDSTSSHRMGLATAFLDYIVAISILPPVIDGSPFPGKGKLVVYLDSNERFSAIRLSKTLRGITSTALNSGSFPNHTQATPADLTHEALNHVHVHRPQSSHQLVATLRSLTEYLLRKQEHKSFERSLGLIVLDSADAFYWQDRARSENVNVTATSAERDNSSSDSDSDTLNARPSRRTMSRPNGTHRIIAAETVKLLRHLQKKFDCAVIFIPQNKFIGDNTSRSVDERGRNLQAGETSFPPYAISNLSNDPWDSFPTMSLVITPINSVPQFPSTVSIDHCIRERESREAAHTSTKYAIRVDWTKDNNWGPTLKAQIQELVRRGRGQLLMSFGRDGFLPINQQST
ncbi:MAG: hypothetical protein Q9160_004561 [Pyrenula sp. 1 TL-2023]